MISKYEYYKSIGLSVIPLDGKKPIPTGWERFNIELPNDADLKILNEFGKNKNIGLCLGKASGVMCIDIDTDDKRTLDLIPKSPFVKRGKKGETRFFKFNPNIESKKIHPKKVEIFSESGQTVLPPSIHPETGEPYTWTGEYTFDVSNFRDLLPQLDNILFVNDLPILVNENEPNDIFGRNERLKNIVSACKIRGEQLSDIVSEILKADEKYHFDKQLFLDQDEPYFKRTKNREKAAEVFAKSIIKSIDESLVETLNINNVEILDDDFETKQPTEKFELPKLDGLMLEMSNTYKSIFYAKQPEMIFCSSLMLTSALMLGRFKYRLTTPNLYSLIIGKSGSGKDGVKLFINNVLMHNKLKHLNLLGLSSYNSSVAMVLKLPKQRFRIDVIDESRNLFTQYGNKMSSQSDVFSVLNDLWSLTLSYYRGSYAVSRGDELTGECYNPHINTILMIQPEIFYSGANKLMLSDGSLGRMLIFKSSERSKFDPDFKPDENAIDNLCNIIGGYINLNSTLLKYYDDILDLTDKNEKKSEKTLGQMRAEPLELADSDYAVGYFNDIMHSYEDKIDEAYNESYPHSSFMNRTAEYIKKIAMVSCISRNSTTLEVGDFDFGEKVFAFCLNRAIKECENVAYKTSNNYDPAVDKFISIVKKEKKIPIRKIQRMLDKYGSDFEKIKYIALQKSDSIIVDEHINKNKTTTAVVRLRTLN